MLQNGRRKIHQLLLQRFWRLDEERFQNSGAKPIVLSGQLYVVGGSGTTSARRRLQFRLKIDLPQSGVGFFLTKCH
jgi:hypothetical protein